MKDRRRLYAVLHPVGRWCEPCDLQCECGWSRRAQTCAAAQRVAWSHDADHWAGRVMTHQRKAKRPPLDYPVPFIWPCRDPLALWFLEYEELGHRYRRYYADRDEARQALKFYKRTGRMMPSGSVPPVVFLDPELP